MCNSFSAFKADFYLKQKYLLPLEISGWTTCNKLCFLLGIRHIAFNPVAPTNMVRALAAVAKEESASGVREFRVPDKESLTALAESSSGDIR